MKDESVSDTGDAVDFRSDVFEPWTATGSGLFPI